MKIPKCCGSEMVQWAHTFEETGKRRYGCDFWCCWRCQDCGRERPLYRYPIAWLWLEARRQDVYDGIVSKKWWLGSIGSLTRLDRNSVTFAPIPINALVDYGIKAWSWVKFRRPDELAKELDRHYSNGRVDGRNQQRAQMEAEQMRECAACQDRQTNWSS